MPHAHESKKLRTPPDAFRQVVTDTERQHPDSVRRRDIRRNVRLSNREVSNRLAQIVRDAEPGPDGVKKAVDRARSALTTVLGRMQRLGVEAAGLPGFRHDSMLDDLAFFIEGELEFFRNFVSDFAQEAKMPLDARAALYGGSAEAMFWRAWTDVMPRGAQIWWRLGIAEHCCITTPDSRILTARGLVPIRDVVVGDLVLTHRRRWRRVLACHRHHPKPEHRFLRLLAPTGAIVECTDDHRWMTDAGWIEAGVMRTMYGPKWERAIHACSYWEEVQNLFPTNATRRKGGFAQGVQEPMLMRTQEVDRRRLVPQVRAPERRPKGQRPLPVRGMESKGVDVLCDMPSQGAEEVKAASCVRHNEMSVRQDEGPEIEALSRLSRRRGEASVRRPEAVTLHANGASRCAWQKAILRNVLHQRQTREHQASTLDLGEEAWSDTERLRHSPQERRSIRRPTLQSGVDGRRRASASSPPEEIVLYDLTVEEDHSFICEGLVSHNSDCLGLAAGSPYSLPGEDPNPLPTTPRSGDTRCLTNCRCHLQSSAVPAGLMPDVGVEITKMGPLDVDPTSPAALAASAQYRDLAERYAWLMRLHVLDPTGGYGRAAAVVRQGMDNIARVNGQTYRLTQTDREIQAPAVAALNAGLRYRPRSLDDDLVLAVGAVIAMNYADRGKITAINNDPPTVELDDERVYRLDDEGRAILLTDDET